MHLCWKMAALIVKHNNHFTEALVCLPVVSICSGWGKISLWLVGIGAETKKGSMCGSNWEASHHLHVGKWEKRGQKQQGPHQPQARIQEGGNPMEWAYLGEKAKY